MNKEAKRQVEILSQCTVDMISTEQLEAKLAFSLKENRPLRVKYGADPSAPDIHLGHVVGLNKLRTFQDLGHTVVFIIGDFTGMIGDPSGRSKTRKPLTREEVDQNAKSYQEQAFKILDLEKTEVRFNSEWLAPMNFEDVIRLSAHCTAAQILARDDFSKRMKENQPVALVELMYPLVQAYDSVMVRADVELGGTDQLFNLLLGRELQKAYAQEEQVVMTLPLLEGLDGVQKMSKSLDNYIGVAEPAKDIFGKVMSLSDTLMWRYFSLVLGMEESGVAELERAVAKGDRHPRDVKDELAQRIVAKFHDEAAGHAAAGEFKRVFSQGQLPDDIPIFSLSSAEYPDAKIGIIPLLVGADLAPSNSEARRLIQQGAVRLDDEKITDFKTEIAVKDGAILRAGKRGFARVALD